MLESGMLRNHAEDHLVEIYAKAHRLVIIDTGLPVEAFPSLCPFDWQQIESAPIPCATD